MAEKTEKHPGGRPTKYRKEFCQQIIEYFDVEPYGEVDVLTTDKRSGREYINSELRPVQLPTIEAFAHSIDVNPDTLVEWSKVHPEFSAAYVRIKALQKNTLVVNGLMGLYNSGYAIFVSKNFTDMKDATEVSLRKTGDVLDELEGEDELVSEAAAHLKAINGRSEAS